MHLKVASHYLPINSVVSSLVSILHYISLEAPIESMVQLYNGTEEANFFRESR